VDQRCWVREPGGPDVSPYAAAARAEHLEGLPPTFLSVGALDLFLEKIWSMLVAYPAGVPTSCTVYPAHSTASIQGRRRSHSPLLVID